MKAPHVAQQSEPSPTAPTDASAGGFSGGLRAALRSQDYGTGEAMLSPFADAAAPPRRGALPASVTQAFPGADLSRAEVVENSPVPAQSGKAALSRGSQIHVGPGLMRDEVLRHEAAHYLQQQKGATRDGAALANVGQAEREANAAMTGGTVDAAALSPVAQGDYGLGFGELASVIQGIQASAGVGQFVNANFKMSLSPIKWLAVNFQAEGSYSVDENGVQSLSVTVGGGLKFDIPWVIDITANLNFSLSLTGEDLAAAFEDALKQILYAELRAKAVPVLFAHLNRLASGGITAEDLVSLATPLGALERPDIMLVVVVGPAEVRQAYADFVAFFENDASVGFEASVGVSLGAKVDLGVKGGVTLSAAAGIEDVDNVDARGFTEIAAAGELEVGPFKFNGSVSKRWTDGGPNKVGASFGAEVKLPEHLVNTATGTDLLTNAGFVTAVSALFNELAMAEDGETISGLTTVAQTFIEGGAAMGIAGDVASHKLGVDVSLEWVDGEFTSIRAAVKNLAAVEVGFDAWAVAVEGGVSIGSMADVSADFSQALSQQRP